MKTHSVNVLVVLNLASAASVNAQTSDVTNAQVIIISQVVLLLHLIAVTVVVVLRLHRKDAHSIRLYRQKMNIRNSHTNGAQSGVTRNPTETIGTTSGDLCCRKGDKKTENSSNINGTFGLQNHLAVAVKESVNCSGESRPGDESVAQNDGPLYDDPWNPEKAQELLAQTVVILETRNEKSVSPVNTEENEVYDAPWNPDNVQRLLAECSVSMPSASDRDCGRGGDDAAGKTSENANVVEEDTYDAPWDPKKVEKLLLNLNSLSDGACHENEIANTENRTPNSNYMPMSPPEPELDGEPKHDDEVHEDVL